jgi:hypothetical protein
MQGGDISNVVSRRVIVTVDTFIDRVPSVKKVFGIIPVSEEKVTYNRAMLGRFWHFASKSGLILELASFGISQASLDRVIDDLDNLGTNPFNYGNAYATIEDLVAELPHRPEVASVVDVPTRMLRFGSWALDLGRI